LSANPSQAITAIETKARQRRLSIFSTLPNPERHPFIDFADVAAPGDKERHPFIAQ